MFAQCLRSISVGATVAVFPFEASKAVFAEGISIVASARQRKASPVYIWRYQKPTAALKFHCRAAGANEEARSQICAD